MNQIIVDKICDALTIPQVLSYYGYQTSKRKRIPCPLHVGRDPNFCYTDKVFHCWSCGEKGNIISLVMKLHGISFPQALMKLDTDFRLGLAGQTPSYRDRMQMAEERKITQAMKKWEEDKNRTYKGLCVYHRELFRRTLENPLDTNLEALRQEVEAWLEENIGGVVQPWT